MAREWRRMEWSKDGGRGKRIEAEQSNGGVGGVETFSVLCEWGFLKLYRSDNIVQFKVQDELKAMAME